MQIEASQFRSKMSKVAKDTKLWFLTFLRRKHQDAF